MGCMNLVSERVIGTGLVRPDPCHLTAIHGVCSAAGVLTIHNGQDANGVVRVEMALGVGPVRVEMNPDSWRLEQGCYVEFTGALGGDLTFSFR